MRRRNLRPYRHSSFKWLAQSPREPTLHQSTASPTELDLHYVVAASQQAVMKTLKSAEIPFLFASYKLYYVNLEWSLRRGP